MRWLSRGTKQWTAEQGERLSIYSNVDRLEAELVGQAPQDAAEIRRLTWAIRRLANLPLPDPSELWPRKGFAILRLPPYLPLLRGCFLSAGLFRCGA
jgi:hypothetical protein